MRHAILGNSGESPVRQGFKRRQGQDKSVDPRAWADTFDRISMHAPHCSEGRGTVATGDPYRSQSR